MSDWQNPNKTRKIATRLIIRGDLVLESPAQLGSGETEGALDMVLLRDAQEDLPLLTGTSLAGALRAHLLARSQGYGRKELKKQTKNEPNTVVELLFGGSKGDQEGDQSPLIVDDALALPTISEIRDGVRIDPARRTAQDKLKFDGEFLPPGTTFPLRFELLLTDDESQKQRLAVLAAALDSLEQGQIAIGARRSRGFGRCRVQGWRVARFNLRDTEQLLAWLTLDEDVYPALASAAPHPLAQLTDLFGPPIADDRRAEFSIQATFSLETPMLIRAEQPLIEGDEQPDFIHLRDGNGRPVISGTSLAGALRARALRILNTLGLDQSAPQSLLNTLFGKDMLQHSDNPTASRLIVAEAAIDEGQALIQNRVAIDRFTGGAFDTALFSEAPQVGGIVVLRLTIRKPEAAQIGLLLLLLKDLWTGDLPLGGTSSIGRGRLRGQRADLRYKHEEGEPEQWTIVASGLELAIGGDRQRLQDFVTAVRGGSDE